MSPWGVVQETKKTEAGWWQESLTGIWLSVL